MIKRALRIAGLLALAAALTGCHSGGTPPQTLTVMAAASLSEPFEVIGAQFEAAHPGVKVAFSFAGSQQLAQQLANGAPADVFASASAKYIDAAVEAGRMQAGAAQVFATNRLVVIVPAGNPAGLTKLEDLARPGIKLVLAAKEVPAGAYSLEFLDKAAGEMGAAFKGAVMGNVASYEENVKAVLAKVRLGEADAGIVYSSDAATAQGAVRVMDIPDALNVVARYPLAVSSDSRHADLAAAFVDYVLSAQGQAALAEAGFLPPGE